MQSNLRGAEVSEEKQYAESDLMAMDFAGEHYCRHISAMTREELHSKSDIAAELGWRDMQIAELKAQCDALAGPITGHLEKLAGVMLNRTLDSGSKQAVAYADCADMVAKFATQLRAAGYEVKE